MSPAHPAPSVEPALHVRGLSHAFGTRQALDQVEICVVPGEFKVLLGPNGAGKTTLFALASGLFRADAGEIVVFGQALSRAPAACLSKIGMVFQQPSLDLDLSVSENLRYHGALHGLSPTETDARSSETLARLDLADRRKDSVRELNGGHRRRLELARALVHRPRLLLLDEPTVGLDIESRADIVDHTHRLASEDGVAVLWATHLIDEVRAGDSLMILHQGRKAADGSCADVIETAGAGNIADAYSILTRKADGATQ